MSFSGQTIGKYRLDERLGMGSISQVYAATDPQGRRVALKILTPDVPPAQWAGYRERFLTQMGAVSRLNHLYIAPVYDFGVAGDMLYMLYSVLPILPLGLDALHERQPFNAHRLAPLLVNLASALDYAHSQAILHRNLHPGNIRFDEDANPVITDFALAAMLGQVVSKTTLVTMAPERWKSPQASPQSDQYALAAIVYWLLAGRYPFAADSIMGFIKQQLESSPPVLAFGLARGAGEAVMRALSRDPLHRFPSVMAFALAFKNGLRDEDEAIVPYREPPQDLGLRQEAPVAESEIPTAPYIFLSYSRTDVEFVRRLTHDLEFSGFPVWQYQGARPPENWSAVAGQALAGAAVHLIVLSLAALGSEYIRNEYRDSLQQGRRLALLLTGGVRVRDLPAALITQQSFDFHAAYDPAWRELHESLQDWLQPELPAFLVEPQEPAAASPVGLAEPTGAVDDSWGPLEDFLLEKDWQGEGADLEPSAPQREAADVRQPTGEPARRHEMPDVDLSSRLDEMPKPEARRAPGAMPPPPPAPYAPPIMADSPPRPQAAPSPVPRGDAGRAAPPAKTGLAGETVQFTVFYPREAAADNWYTFLAYVHLAALLERVVHDAERFAIEMAHVQHKAVAPQTARLVRGTELRLVPEAPGLDFKPAGLTVRWQEDLERAYFRFRPRPHLFDQPASGDLMVYLGPVEIARVPFSIFILPAETRLSPVTVQNPLARARLEEQRTGQMYHRIFISYSRRDAVVAKAYRLAQLAAGHEVFLDTESIRAGQDWRAALARAIDECDVFQLFWSQHAADSPNVRDEWDYCLNYKCPQDLCRSFIRPVYWQEPMPTPPPELGHLNFRYVPLLEMKTGLLARLAGWWRGRRG